MMYTGKLLLFGEYTTIRGSRSLAVPLDLYSGSWAQSEENESGYPLNDFVSFLEKENDLKDTLNLARFRREVEEGLYFDSNIPVGYGAGSSGALCAAVYERFAYAPIAKEDAAHYSLLRKELAKMEAYFHGSSSGTDPLICYLRMPALLEPSGLIKTVALPAPEQQQGTFFLLDSGISRKTAPLVEVFMKKCEQPAYVRALSSELLEYNEMAIALFLQNERKQLMQQILQISNFQINHFQEMIPDKYQSLWKEGLNSGDYAIKLCGAGGGGFFLGYTMQPLQELKLKDCLALSL